VLGVSVGTVQLWAESGMLQAWKTTGGHRRVMRESVDRLLHKAPSVPAPNEPRRLSIMSPAPEAMLPERLNVVVVEDDPHLLRLYEAKITKWDFAPNFTGFDNAFYALLWMGNQTTDLLITDLQMPELDGFELMRVISTAPETQHTTVVAVSGLDAADIAAHGGLPAGIELLPKPIPFDRLYAIGAELVAKKKTD
jgi:excisionase family DNA binding protein